MCEALSHAIRERRKHGSLGVIAEVKRRRFRGADLLRGRSPAEVACAYQAAGAAAISVVTSAWFGGSMKMLKEVSAANLGLPILRKDLIRNEQDIHASKRAGACAVLLVLRLLGIERLSTMLQAAQDHGIEPFVEVASRREIAEVRQIYHGMLAINNANIESNEVEGDDVSRSISLIECGDPRLWISASRIGGPDDVRALAAAGFDGILIGTHLLLAADVRAATDQIVAAAQARGTHP